MKRLTAVVGLILLGACSRYTGQPGAPRITGWSTPRDRYEADLEKEVGAGRLEGWRVAGRRALRERLAIRPSFREIVRFSSERPSAVGYRLPLKRGQKIRVDLERVAGKRGDLFVEVFEELNPPSAMFMHRFSLHPDAKGFQYEATVDGDYVIRVQPELDLGGTYRITLTTAAGLAFPVLDSNLKSIGSFFGDARDGGARDHEGVDIFAPRGSLVVAVAAGVITGVRTTPRGGRVVWQRDDVRSVSYYYAHLQEQRVHEGQRVAPGDVLGTVGTTGNAQGTRPHLHFSVYRPGQVALDPVPFLYDQPGDAPAPVLVDTRALGEWSRVSANGVRLRSGPDTDSQVLRELSRDARVLAIGGVRDWQRVMLEDGTTGFVAGWLLQPQSLYSGVVPERAQRE